MNKAPLLQAIIDKLQADLQVAQRALQTAYEAATHEENVAENKYDTLGLEAGYLAHGQSRRVSEIEQALALYRQLHLRPYDEVLGIQLTARVVLMLESGERQIVFLGPDSAGLKVREDGDDVLVITPRSPLGQNLLGKTPGDVLETRVGATIQSFEIVDVA